LFSNKLNYQKISTLLLSWDKYSLSFCIILIHRTASSIALILDWFVIFR
jgi:hypothetical protein